jgi:uncharacterized protein YebE (UPF0316 family)
VEIRAGQATDGNTAHAYCMLDNYCYKYTLRVRNIIAIPLQQWLHDGASVLLYTYIVCLALIISPFDSVKTDLITASLNEPYLRK